MNETAHDDVEFLGFLGTAENLTAWPQAYFLAIQDQGFTLFCEHGMEGKREVVCQGASAAELALFFRSRHLYWGDAYMEMRRFAPDFALAFREAVKKSEP